MGAGDPPHSWSLERYPPLFEADGRTPTRVNGSLLLRAILFGAVAIGALVAEAGDDVFSTAPVTPTPGGIDAG